MAIPKVTLIVIATVVVATMEVDQSIKVSLLSLIDTKLAPNEYWTFTACVVYNHWL